MVCYTSQQEPDLRQAAAGIISSTLGIPTSKVIYSDDGDAANTPVYGNEYGIDSSNNQAALLLEIDVATENIRQAEEGAVLLANQNNALSLPEGVQVTVFGNGAFHSVGTSTRTPFESITASTLPSALQTVLGADNVDTVLDETAYADLGTTGIRQVTEGAIADVRAQEAAWKGQFNDAAIVVLSRGGGESNDPAMITEEGRHYLGLSPNEENLMAYLQEQKGAGVFKRIVVLINSEQAMELVWLDDYDVDACLVVGRPGSVGYTGVANILAGSVNPSGRVVDTYAANSLSAPAITYTGANTRQWSNLD